MAAFLDERIGFTDIPMVVESALEDYAPREPDTLEAVAAADRSARERAARAVVVRTGRRAFVPRVSKPAAATPQVTL